MYLMKSIRRFSTVSSGYDVVVVGGGSAGISVSASLRKRNSDLKIAVIEPSEKHYYQPGWTMVGGGVFDAPFTMRDTASILPNGVQWVKSSVTSFDPDNSSVTLDDSSQLSYKNLVVCPGLKLDWGKVKGLEETLGKNGVTSNYRYDLAPYTWELVQNLGANTKAVFTQPPMPIKCAGAPQKALYLSCDHWSQKGILKNIDVSFCNAGGVLFGVAAYVPALMKYIQKYNADVKYFYNLVEIDGSAKKATFEVCLPDTEAKTVEMDFDMIHVCPPQCAPDFIRSSPLSDAAGWVDVNQETLRHKNWKNIWSLGDVTNSPNAKTAAAVRKQAPIVAENILADIHGTGKTALYDGYGSCPLTVERGKIVLAEFGFGGKIIPSLPTFILEGMVPTRLAWFLKEKILPPLYWHGMLKGFEPLATPTMVDRRDE